eukprot:TRINITY_DN838_c0_g2_i1.p1 TRINITY_DN838_c0_g2~~TRINITY_DN838_c0_g2_i1.p1  ORF type:complete len:319 (+),score=59.62 TRINITY_DN838_c0_g2_i1:213-1169(+)
MSFAQLKAKLARGNSMSSSKHDEPLTKEQEDAKVAELRASLGPLSERAALFCTDDTLHRYLRARSWNMKKAEKMLRDTITWRAEYRPEDIKWEEVSHEAESGKMYRTPYTDKFNRTVLVMRPGRENTSNHETQIRYLVYCLERSILALPPGGEQMVWFIDYNGWTLKNSPPLKTARETLHILQNHYPERLGFAICHNPPKVFQSFWQLVQPFVDPKTHKKIKFCYDNDPSTMKIISDLFDLDKLETIFGGRSTWTYDQESYGKVMKQEDLHAEQLYGPPPPPSGVRQIPDVASLKINHHSSPSLDSSSYSSAPPKLPA